jgi:hypothetical protein
MTRRTYEKNKWLEEIENGREGECKNTRVDHREQGDEEEARRVDGSTKGMARVEEKEVWNETKQQYKKTQLMEYKHKKEALER